MVKIARTKIAITSNGVKNVVMCRRNGWRFGLLRSAKVVRRTELCIFRLPSPRERGIEETHCESVSYPLAVSGKFVLNWLIDSNLRPLPPPVSHVTSRGCRVQDERVSCLPPGCE